MVKDSNRNSEPKPPNNFFQKLLIVLGLLAVILSFLGGISIAVLFMNRQKIFTAEQPTSTPSPSLSNIPSPSPTLPPETPSPSPSPSPSPTLPTQSPTPSPEAQNSATTVNRQGLIFELKSCKKIVTDVTNQKIQCFVNITNTQDNSQITIHANNNQLQRSRILALGQENVSTIASLGSNSGNYDVKNNLLKNAPMTAVFYFEKVPAQITKIEVLEISAVNKEDMKIEFRNIALSDS